MPIQHFGLHTLSKDKTLSLVFAFQALFTGSIVDGFGKLWWENVFMCTYDQVLTNFLIGDADPTS